jgi:3-methyl-2-oxobutanoate hydroxymethyltransferase
VSPRRLTASAIRRRKGEPFAVVTAYDAPFGRLAEEAGIDVLLCGDSLGMVVLGYASTTSVDLEDMCRHVAALARGTHKAHLIGDLPFGSFEAGDGDAVRSATALIRAGATSVKIEAGARNVSRVRAIADAGIPVCGHIGVLPQTAGLDAGFRRKNDRAGLIADLDAVVAAGVFTVVFEMVDFEIARELTARSPVPTIGIGSGGECDAQVLVLHDVLGLYPEAPPFAKRFGEIGAATTAALRDYAQAVRSRSFPEPAKHNGETGSSVYTIGGTER